MATMAMAAMAAMAMAMCATRAGALETRAVTRAIDERAFAVEDGMRMAFTHDVDHERTAFDARGAGVDSDGKGNPGMIYARVFDGNGASGFRLGGEDALCVIVREPPPNARYFSFAPYVYRRGARVVSAQAGHSINNANVKRRDGEILIFVATHSSETFAAMRTAFIDGGYDEGAVNLVPLFDDVRYGGFGGDLLSISFRVAFWPSRLNATGEDVLGEWSRLEWPAFIARRASSGAARVGSTVSQALPPSTLNLTFKVDKQHEAPTTAAPVVVVDGAARVGSTTLVVMPVDHARCRRDPFYSPWSTAGVSVRSACFGATTDALYSISRDFMRAASLREFLIVVRGRDVVSRGRATFTTIALYATGGPISSFMSARDVRVLAAIDDRVLRRGRAFIALRRRLRLFARRVRARRRSLRRRRFASRAFDAIPRLSRLPRILAPPPRRRADPTLVVDAFAL